MSQMRINEMMKYLTLVKTNRTHDGNGFLRLRILNLCGEELIGTESL